MPAIRHAMTHAVRRSPTRSRTDASPSTPRERRSQRADAAAIGSREREERRRHEIAAPSSACSSPENDAENGARERERGDEREPGQRESGQRGGGDVAASGERAPSVELQRRSRLASRRAGRVAATSERRRSVRACGCAAGSRGSSATGRSAFAIATARSGAAALFTRLWCSAAGSESATSPAPACTRATPSAR